MFFLSFDKERIEERSERNQFMQKQKKTKNSGSWKELVEGFVSGMLAQVSDNVSQHIHVWIGKLKRRAAGSVLMLLGATYFLTGFSDYISSLFGKDFPGFGSGVVGLIVIFIGYLISRD